MAVLVGREAPDFKAQFVMPDGSFVQKSLQDYRGKHVVLFFYPLDFSFVCPTEILAFDNALAEFKERNCEVLGVSVDSRFAHHAWRNTAPEKGGIGNIHYPLVADIDKDICAKYDVLRLEGDIAYRGVFLIDKDGIVRHQAVNDMPLGRNIFEVLRMVDALQFHEQHGEVCPANWNMGKQAMKPDAESVAAFLAKNAKSL